MVADCNLLRVPLLPSVEHTEKTLHFPTFPPPTVVVVVYTKRTTALHTATLLEQTTTHNYFFLWEKEREKKNFHSICGAVGRCSSFVTDRN